MAWGVELKREQAEKIEFNQCYENSGFKAKMWHIFFQFLFKYMYMYIDIYNSMYMYIFQLLSTLLLQINLLKAHPEGFLLLEIWFSRMRLPSAH